LAEYTSAEDINKPHLLNRVIDGAQKLIVLAETHETIKPLALSFYEAIETLSGS